MLIKRSKKSLGKLSFIVFCAFSLFGIAFLTIQIMRILFIDVGISNASDSHNAYSSEMMKSQPISDLGTQQSQSKQKFLRELFSKTHASGNQSESIFQRKNKDLTNSESQQYTNYTPKYIDGGRSEKNSQGVSQRRAANYSSGNTNEKKSYTNTQDQPVSWQNSSYSNDSKKNYEKNRNLIKAKNLGQLFPDIFEDEKTKEKITFPEVAKEEQLGPFEYSIYSFKPGDALGRYAESDKSKILERIACPPDVTNTDASDLEKLKLKIQTLGYNGELAIAAENGFIINGEGPDFYLHLPVLAESFANEADVYAVTENGDKVPLGRAVSGIMGNAPIDLAVAGISHTQMIVIQDVYPLTEEEKAALTPVNEFFSGFYIDSIELAHTIKYNQKKKEM